MSLSPKIVQLDFVQVELYDNYLIATVKEGVVFDTKHLDAFYEIFDSYYPDTPFVYIANRKNDYSVNPTCYMKSSKYPNLVGMAMMCYTKPSMKNAEFEKKFYEKPFEVFESMEKAISWASIIVNNSHKYTHKNQS